MRQPNHPPSVKTLGYFPSRVCVTVSRINNLATGEPAFISTFKFEKGFMNKYLDKIDNDIAEKHLLKHPFYLAWTRGELSRGALADYARQYYHHVAAFPTYLSAVHANSDNQTTRKQLLSNLIDEEAGSPNHPELWLKFAEGFGVSQSRCPLGNAVRRVPPSRRRVLINQRGVIPSARST